MTIASMTGFARSEGQADGCTYVWEAKSVNARGLEIRCRLSQGFEGLEPAVRKRVAAAFKRGNVAVALQIFWMGGAHVVRINTDVLDRILELVPQVERRLAEFRPSTAEGLLGLRGVIETLDPSPTGDTRAALEESLLAGLDRTLAELGSVRRAEGDRLDAALAGHLQRIGALCEQAQSLASAQPQAIYARLGQQVAALLAEVPALPAERLAQESALMATKADPREELDRISAHHEAAVDLLRGEGPVGRQLDFLCQEFNRETNTLCAKSSDIELTRIGLEMKAAIEQFREQVQNIE